MQALVDIYRASALLLQCNITSGCRASYEPTRTSAAAVTQTKWLIIFFNTSANKICPAARFRSDSHERCGRTNAKNDPGYDSGVRRTECELLQIGRCAGRSDRRD